MFGSKTQIGQKQTIPSIIKPLAPVSGVKCKGIKGPGTDGAGHKGNSKYFPKRSHK